MMIIMVMPTRLRTMRMTMTMSMIKMTVRTMKMPPVPARIRCTHGCPCIFPLAQSSRSHFDFSFVCPFWMAHIIFKAGFWITNMSMIMTSLRGVSRTGPQSTNFVQPSLNVVACHDDDDKYNITMWIIMGPLSGVTGLWCRD